MRLLLDDPAALPAWCGWVVLLVFVGFLSGVLPSPLYSRRWPDDDTECPRESLPLTTPDDAKLSAAVARRASSVAKGWPRWYLALQSAVLLLTLAHLHRAKESELAPNWAGLRRSIRALSLLEPLRAACYVSLSVGLWAGCRWADRRWPCCGGPRGVVTVVIRNILVYAAVLWVDCGMTAALDCGGIELSGMPLSRQVVELSQKWQLYHQPHFLLVRISHAFTYLPVLMCLSRGSLVDFARWRIFMLFVPDAIADWAHYADSPEIARARLHYEGGELCAGVDRHFVRTAVSFPMNWAYLTT